MMAVVASYRTHSPISLGIGSAPGLLVVAMLAVLFASGCGDEMADPTPDKPWVWDVPEGFPAPAVPERNPMNEAKVELGRRLFYDKRLSGNETFSCASCHDQSLSFTDALAQAEGSTGEIHPRGSMSLANIGYASTFTWANPTIADLEEQALGPMFGETPVELGLSGREQELFERLRADAEYPRLFGQAFPEDGGEISVDTITKAIACFQRTLISGDAPYDRFVAGDSSAMSESAQAGMALFFSERMECFHCHGGFNFSDSVFFEGSAFREAAFHNTGLYNVDGDGSYPTGNQGLFEVSDDPSHRGHFKAPSLRNIAVTAPYMHDGSVATLDEVLDHYEAGGRTIEDGPKAGVGADNPLKSGFMVGFTLTEGEREDVKAFLESLTDETFLNNPAHSDPF